MRLNKIIKGLPGDSCYKSDNKTERLVEFYDNNGILDIRVAGWHELDYISKYVLKSFSKHFRLMLTEYRQIMFYLMKLYTYDDP